MKIKICIKKRKWLRGIDRGVIERFTWLDSRGVHHDDDQGPLR